MPHKLLGVPEDKRSKTFLNKERAFLTASMIVESENREKIRKRHKKRK